MQPSKERIWPREDYSFKASGPISWWNYLITEISPCGRYDIRVDATIQDSHRGHGSLLPSGVSLLTVGAGHAREQGPVLCSNLSHPKPRLFRLWLLYERIVSFSLRNCQKLAQKEEVGNKISEYAKCRQAIRTGLPPSNQHLSVGP